MRGFRGRPAGRRRQRFASSSAGVPGWRSTRAERVRRGRVDSGRGGARCIVRPRAPSEYNRKRRPAAGSRKTARRSTPRRTGAFLRDRPSGAISRRFSGIRLGSGISDRDDPRRDRSGPGRGRRDRRAWGGWRHGGGLGGGRGGVGHRRPGGRVAGRRGHHRPAGLGDIIGEPRRAGDKVAFWPQFGPTQGAGKSSQVSHWAHPTSPAATARATSKADPRHRAILSGGRPARDPSRPGAALRPRDPKLGISRSGDFAGGGPPRGAHGHSGRPRPGPNDHRPGPGPRDEPNRAGRRRTAAGGRPTGGRRAGRGIRGGRGSAGCSSTAPSSRPRTSPAPSSRPDRPIASSSRARPTVASEVKMPEASHQPVGLRGQEPAVVLGDRPPHPVDVAGPPPAEQPDDARPSRRPPSGSSPGSTSGVEPALGQGPPADPGRGEGPGSRWPGRGRRGSAWPGAVHPGRQAALAVALHGVGRQGEIGTRGPALGLDLAGVGPSPRTRPSRASGGPSGPGRRARRPRSGRRRRGRRRRGRPRGPSRSRRQLADPAVELVSRRPGGAGAVARAGPASPRVGDRRARVGLGRGGAEAGGEVEGAAPARPRSRPRSGRPSARPACDEIERPRPVPPYRRVVEPSAWLERVEDHRELVGRDADPVCRRRRSGAPGPAGRPTRPRPRRATSPRSVNLIALPRRFMRTWRSRSGSPTRASGTSGRDGRPRAPAPSPRPGGRAVRIASSTVSRGRNRIGSRSSLPASILEKSRMSLIRPRSDVGRRPDHLEVLALGRGRGPVSRARSVMPMMRVHRRADLVAHVGQELALGPRGRLGGLARPDGLALGPPRSATSTTEVGVGRGQLGGPLVDRPARPGRRVASSSAWPARRPRATRPERRRQTRRSGTTSSKTTQAACSAHRQGLGASHPEDRHRASKIPRRMVGRHDGRRPGSAPASRDRGPGRRASRRRGSGSRSGPPLRWISRAPIEHLRRPRRTAGSRPARVGAGPAPTAG